MAERCNRTMVDSDNPTLEFRLTKVPLRALTLSTRKQIALFLDIESDIIQTEIGRLRDWRGVAELATFRNIEIMNFKRMKSPTLELLNNWEINKDYTPNVGDLWLCLLQLDRNDVIVECKSMIERDAKNHIDREQRLLNDYIPVQEDIISSSTHMSGEHYIDETRYLTIHDITNPDSLIIYDAFVCSNSDSRGRDTSFVKECVKQLENNRGLQLCIPERDCLIGGAKHIIDAELIKSRCKKMIIVISHEFLHSPVVDFQVKFAHSLEPGARKKRLIPVLLDDGLPIPDILRHVTLCDYTKPDLMEWFWDRLAASVKAPTDTEQNCNQLRAPCIPKTVRNSSCRPFSRSSKNSSSDSSNSLVSMTSMESFDSDVPTKTGCVLSSEERHGSESTNTSLSTRSISEPKEERYSKAKTILTRIQNFVKK